MYEIEAAAVGSTLLDIAAAITARRMEVPAIFLLEMHKPLAGLAYHSIQILEPLLLALVGARRVRAAVAVLQSPDGIERLITMLEEQRKN